jgi:hypothetical protein
MPRKSSTLLLLLLLAGCAVQNHAPPFANVPYEPFSRSAAVAVALDEWRLWGAHVDDNDGAGYVQTDATMPERQQGLWQRVGEYWWEGMNADAPSARWTGKHDGAGHVFPVAANGDYAWSAAFISYVMRIAGAGTDFPYAADHATYINAAARHAAHGLLDAEDPAVYAPRLGDLVCFPRDWARNIRFADLPTSYDFPAHCGIVAAITSESLAIIGGNVDDAVTMEHPRISTDGRLADIRQNWLVVLRVNYASP